MICPECGCPDARHLQDIRYPKGTVTQVLDCPECKKLVLQGCLPNLPKESENAP